MPRPGHPAPGFFVSPRAPAMPCQPCAKARAAVIAGVRHVSTGEFAEARQDARKFRDALAEKAEAMRIRIATARKA